MLKGQKALVTGAARGIGRAIALALAGQGADLVINYGHDEAGAKETAAMCMELGVNAICIQADVSDAAAVDAMFDEMINAFGRVDILVNNAGITKDNLILRMKKEEFDQVIDINLGGTYNCLKKASRLMLKQRYGRIINISSIVGLRGNAGQANYAASKAGVIGMTKSLAKELASKGITVNAVTPGMIETDMTAVMTDAMKEATLSSIPMGRIGRGEDVAAAVCFFASPAASYVTGQVLSVDGGMAV